MLGDGIKAHLQKQRGAMAGGLHYQSGAPCPIFSRAVPGDVPAHGPPDELTGGALPRSPHGLSDLQKHGLMVGCWGGSFGDCITSVLRYWGEGLKEGQGRDRSNLEEQMWANKMVASAIRNLEGSKYSCSVFGKKKTEAQDTSHQEER